MTPAPDTTVLIQALTAVEPYLPEMVLIGGWVPQVYRTFGGFANWDSSLSLTTEADLLIDPAIQETDRPPLTALLRQAGFKPMTQGPIAAVWETTDAQPLRIEFLVPHVGPEAARRRLRTIRGQPGIGAIPLTDLTVLSRFVRQLSIPRQGKGTSAPIAVRVPTLGAYVVNKAATFGQRLQAADGSNPLGGKDLVYLRDLMAAGPGVRAQIAGDLALIVSNTTVRATTRAARTAVHNLQSGWPEATLDSAIREFAERDRVSDPNVARADLLGFFALLGDTFEALDHAG